jgi:glutaminyl-tRNA synthetase
MAVMDPVKLVITNFAEDEVMSLSVANHPKDADMGQRAVFLTREIYIDRADFKMEANRKYKRLVLHDEVRLRGAYVVKAESVSTDDAGNIVEIQGTYDPETLGVNPPDRKVRGVIHWVSASKSSPAEFRRFQPLFSVANPDAEEGDYRSLINPQSQQCFMGYVETGVLEQEASVQFQFEREGYFVRDPEQNPDGIYRFNETVGLRDSWSKSNASS